MNILLKSTSILIVMSLAISGIMADDRPNIPATSWEQHPEGTALVILLVTRAEQGIQKSAIKVFIKNTSSAVRYLPSRFDDDAVKIYYIDNNSNHIPLRDYTIIVPKFVLAPAMPDSRPYEPGEVGIRNIDLSARELAIVKRYPVFCRFYISDQAVGVYKPIESTPRLLTETIDTPSDN